MGWWQVRGAQLADARARDSAAATLHRKVTSPPPSQVLDCNLLTLHRQVPYHNLLT